MEQRLALVLTDEKTNAALCFVIEPLKTFLMPAGTYRVSIAHVVPGEFAEGPSQHVCGNSEPVSAA
jgi:hypothetical protein